MTLFQNYILIIAWMTLWPLECAITRVLNDKANIDIPERTRSTAFFLEAATYIIVLVCIVKAGPA